MKTFKDRLKQPSTWGVIAFVVLFVWGLVRWHEAEAAEIEATVGLGFGAARTSPMIAQEIGARFDGKWGLAVIRTGNKPGVEDAWVYRAERVVTWREGRRFEPIMALGVAYWNPSPDLLVSENLTFAMAVGVRAWDSVELRWQHYSTAGRADQNDGVDYVSLTATMKF